MNESRENKKGSVDSTDLNCIKSIYGENVSSYLGNNIDVIEKKTKTGAYLVTNRNTFDKCQRLFEAHFKKEARREVVKEKVNKPLVELQKNCYDLPKMFERIVNDDTVIAQLKADNRKAKKSCAPVQFQLSLLISFKDCLKQVNQIKWLTISNSGTQCVTKEWNYEEVFQLMMQTQIGWRSRLIDYNSCFEEIRPILIEFHRRHKQFNYFTSLQRILEVKKHTKVQQDASQFISQSQFQRYFSQIFGSVIPLSLFGNNRNVKLVKNAFKEYYRTAINDKISLDDCVRKLHISCITWLRPIQDKATRWLVIAKVTKWIFEKYLTAILRAVFITQKSLSSGEKVILSSENWRARKRDYLRRAEETSTIVECSENADTGRSRPSGQLVLYPKPKGIRPVYKKEPNNKDEVELFKTLLQQLYLERHDYRKISDLHSIFRSHITKNNEQEKQQLALVACDIENAYASIIQVKLYDIIHTMINEIPKNMLTAKWYAILTRPVYGSTVKLNYTRWFTCSEAPCLASQSIVVAIEDQSHVTQNIKKEAALNWIKKYVFNQSFQIGKKKYTLKNGVPQGYRLSSILAEIYYGTMSNQEFGYFIKSGTLFRYVDDFLFIAKDEDQAKGFLKAIVSNIPEYNCFFNSSKIQTNVTSSLCEKSKFINFLGYRVDASTLDVFPKFGNIEFKDCKCLKPVDKDKPVALFAKRLGNMRFLKLCPLVLDNEINSENAILTTVSLIAYKMASRCVFLILTMFKDVSRSSTAIMDAIRASIKKLSRKIKQHLHLPGPQEMRLVMTRICVAIWKSFLRAFSKRIDLQKHFSRDIKRTIAMLESYEYGYSTSLKTK